MADDTAGNSDSSANAETASASEHGMVSRTVSIPHTRPDSADVSGGAGNRADHGWVVRLIETEGPGILRMLWRILGREQDVMDAYQDCFCKLTACRHRNDLANVKAYAYRTAANIAIELIRTRGRRTAHWPTIAAAQANASADKAVEERDESRFSRLREAIGRLPTHLRNVVALRDLSRMSYKEVGRMLGIEAGTARVYRRHAMVKLAELLEEGEAS